ncbi:uncharacterized protein VTP21DRAFT_9632 [Calcarisporiella thermophila]|uniref:uncharacterized protein n=1 Tax=Calcarisporiella thermophila TaxID=911321 RepID=UPI0037438778
MSSRDLNPKTQHYEFGGPLGTILVMLSSSSIVYFLFLTCNEKQGCSIDPSSLRQAWHNFQWRNIFDWNVTILYLLWVSFQAILYYIAPGKTGHGPLLRDGSKLIYPINGLSAFIITMMTAAATYFIWGIYPFIYVYDHFIQFATAAYLLSNVQAVFLYLYSFRPGTLFNLIGNTGSPLYDFFIGRPLNPRIGSFDLKFFCELRPGMIGWVVLNLCTAAKQFQLQGQITHSMLAVVLFEAIYVVDVLVNEEALLMSNDITSEGFGWMLSFGDLCWVPFTYSLQARYLAFHPIQLSPLALSLISILFFASYAVFRLSNTEKNAFRANPDNPALKHLKFIETEAGSKLLISGWWGVARHINYTTDWLVGLAWCLCTGFDATIPYFYAIYFGLLLLYRNERDEHKCQLKYKKDWDRYRKLVPYKLIPGIY